MLIDPSAPVDKPETAQMVVIHKLFRREFRLLPAAIAAVADGDITAAKPLAAHAQLMLALLHEHHESEDELIWPLLHARVPIEDELIETMERQHQTVADLIEQLHPDLAGWRSTAGEPDRRRLVTNLERLHPALEEHLDLEETAVLPLIHDHLTVAEWIAPQKKAASGKLPGGPKAGLILTGAVLEDANPAEQQWFLHELPAPVRLIWKVLGPRMYAAHLQVVRRPESVGLIAGQG
jgi:hemerythrin-like domain-containing protein